MKTLSRDKKNAVSVESFEDSVRVSVEDTEGRSIVIEAGDGRAGLWMHGTGMVEKLAFITEYGSTIIGIEGKYYPLSSLAKLLESVNS